MKIHIISGFLGSGKTTAISNAAKLLRQKSIIAGVVTNDQGKYLVDSKFMQNWDIPNAEVTGGCFCCNYNALDENINQLISTAQTSVVFAESVGSCTDLMATVIKPISKFRAIPPEDITFSCFVDAKMLLDHFNGAKPPFSPETTYIWTKQIEEAEILVINKIDLLNDADLLALKERSLREFAAKVILFQNSIDFTSVETWVSQLHSFRPAPERKVLSIDYTTYGAGEAQLAWLDEELSFYKKGGNAVEIASLFIETLLFEIRISQFAIGHLKFLLDNGKEVQKLSITTVFDENRKTKISMQEANKCSIVVNARIQTSPERLRGVFEKALKSVSSATFSSFSEQKVNYFQPGYPNPTHRFSA